MNQKSEELFQEFNKQKKIIIDLKKKEKKLEKYLNNPTSYGAYEISMSELIQCQGMIFISQSKVKEIISKMNSI